MDEDAAKSVAVIVAHPDDETLWAGGTIISHEKFKHFIITLCRASDKDRAPKFYKVLGVLNATGRMGDMDDEPEQSPLDESEVKKCILSLLPTKPFDVIITHNPSGEYTRHLRHEEVSSAVIKLWVEGKISASELWTFAYDDGNKQYYPRAAINATIKNQLTQAVWLKKYSLITDTYGFHKDGFEAMTTPRTEAFWKFTSREESLIWLNKGGVIK